MILDSRFDFSDAVDSFCFETLDFDKFSDEELLAFINEEPRIIGFRLRQLERAYEEIERRKILIEHPITLQERSDDWLAARRGDIKQEISALSKQQDALKEERELIDAEFIRRFNERGTSGTRTSLYTITMKEDDNYPETYDRTEFEEYVLSTGKIHLLQKRLSMSAIQEEIAVLQEEYQGYIERLNQSENKEETAIDIYYELFGGEDNNVLEAKLDVLRQTNTLVSTLEQELKDYFSIPGIRLVKKLTINSKKRG